MAVRDQQARRDLWARPVRQERVALRGLPGRQALCQAQQVRQGQLAPPAPPGRRASLARQGRKEKPERRGRRALLALRGRRGMQAPLDQLGHKAKPDPLGPPASWETQARLDQLVRPGQPAPRGRRAFRVQLGPQAPRARPAPALISLANITA